MSQTNFNFFGNSMEDYIKWQVQRCIDDGKLSKSNAVSVLEEIRQYSRRHKSEDKIGKKLGELVRKYI